MVSRTTIEEANKHLHAMHLHSTYLENSLEECKEIIKENEERYCKQIQDLRKEKDAKIKELTEKIKHLEQERKKEQQILSEKENDIRLLRGRLSVFKQIFQFLPGLRSFVGVIENARQLAYDDGIVLDDTPHDIAMQTQMNMQVPSIAKHNIPSKKFRNLSVSDDSDDEITDKSIKSVPNGMVKPTPKNELLLDDKTAEVFL